MSGEVVVERNFVNVGQALFAIEKHNGQTIVYDCGGESRLIVAAVLPYILKKGSIIDILFISHYDNDHINGVQYLLGHCNIKHLVLPEVEDAFKFFPLLNMSESSFAYGLTLDPMTAVHNEIDRLRANGEENKMLPKIHLVESVEHSYRDADIRHPMHIDDFGSGQQIPGNRSICVDKNDDWIYLPFNRKTMTQAQWEAFLDYLELPRNYKCDDFISHWKSHWIDEIIYAKPWWHPFEKRHPLKEAWHEATSISVKEINDHSMPLYSGPAEKIARYGCLYTGDYNAHKYMTDLQRFYDHLWSNIEVVQVPHHGSNSNFNDQLIIKGAIHVIPNKEVPFRVNDVKYRVVWDTISRAREKVVGTWQEPLI